MKSIAETLYALIQRSVEWIKQHIVKTSGALGGWNADHIGQRNFVIVVSFIVGICSGLAAVILKNFIEFVKNFVFNTFPHDNYNLMLLVTPAVGILITLFFVKFFVRDNLGHGITKILYAISQRGSNIAKHHSYSNIIASSFTIGFGGSVGAEAPIALSGASIGSNIGKMFGLDYKTVTLLMACGAAGGIAGAFKAPIAGMIFTLEILMLNLTMASIAPLLISAISSTAVTYYFLGRDVEFVASSVTDFNLWELPFYVVLGLFAGIVALAFTRGMWFCERKMGAIHNIYKRWAIGCLVLGTLIFIFPPLYGEGYSTITSLLNGEYQSIIKESPISLLGNNEITLLVFAIGVLMFKTFATASTTGAGGVGGTFAPSLFIGGVAGFVFAYGLNMLGIITLPIENFTLVGMAGVMSGVMHAPLTSIFLIAEITNGYQLLVPLMIASAVSYITIGIFEQQSIYTKPLADEGKLLTHERDKTVLTLMHIGSVIEKNFIVLSPKDTLGQLVQAVTKSHRNLFPVVNLRGELIGVVLLNDIKEVMFNKELYDTMLVREVMTIPPSFVEADEPMESVMNKFERTGAWNLPVLQNRKYVGFVSKSNIFSAYRQVLTQMSYE